MLARRHEAKEHDHGIDLAPMLDFVLNLLIFFIITTSFIKEAGVAVERPTAKTSAKRDTGNILVAIRPNGEVWMDRRRVDVRELRQGIERIHIERPDDTVVVIADTKSHAGVLAKVMDEIKKGGIKEVAVSAAPSA